MSEKDRNLHADWRGLTAVNALAAGCFFIMFLYLSTPRTCHVHLSLGFLQKHKGHLRGLGFLEWSPEGSLDGVPLFCASRD